MKSFLDGNNKEIEKLKSYKYSFITSTKNDEKGFVAGCDEQCKQLFLKKIADYDKQIALTMRINGYK